MVAAIKPNSIGNYAKIDSNAERKKGNKQTKHE